MAGHHLFQMLSIELYSDRKCCSVKTFQIDIQRTFLRSYHTTFIEATANICERRLNFHFHTL